MSEPMPYMQTRKQWEEMVKRMLRVGAMYIKNAQHYYYDKDTSIMSDAEFDQLWRTIVALEELYPDLVQPDSPTQDVGN